MGHEFCGRVLEAPAGSSLQKGTPVMVDPRVYCNSCSACHVSATNQCETFAFLGLSGGGGGGLSETVAVDERMIHILPNSLSLKYTALIEPLAVALHAVRQAGVDSLGDHSCLIIGGGPIGLAIILILRAWGAKEIFVSEPSPARRRQAIELADYCFDPISEKVAHTVRSLTDGRGVSIAFDCAGIQPGIRDGFDALQRKGIYVNVASWEVPVRYLFYLSFVFRSIDPSIVEPASRTSDSQRVDTQRIYVLQ